MLTLEITEEDIFVARMQIRRAKMGRTTICPIAQSLKRSGISFRCVGCSFINFGKEKGFVLLPDSAQSFISSFDLGNPVEPITFEIDY